MDINKIETEKLFEPWRQLRVPDDLPEMIMKHIYNRLPETQLMIPLRWSLATACCLLFVALGITWQLPAAKQNKAAYTVYSPTSYTEQVLLSGQVIDTDTLYCLAVDY